MLFDPTVVALSVVGMVADAMRCGEFTILSAPHWKVCDIRYGRKFAVGAHIFSVGWQVDASSDEKPLV